MWNRFQQAFGGQMPQMQMPQMNPMVGFGAAMHRAGQPSLTPVSSGQMFGQAMQAARGIQQQNQFRNMMTDMRQKQQLPWLQGQDLLPWQRWSGQQQNPLAGLLSLF